MRRTLGPLLALVLAGPALAQEREPSGLRFARALSERGWTDLAGLAVDALASDRATTGALREQLDLLRADLLTHEATSAPSARERQEKAAAARALYEQLARAGAGAPAAQEAQLRAGEVLLQVGEAALRRLLDPATDAAEREPARAEARAAFSAAATHFAALEAAWAEAVAGLPEDDPDAPDAVLRLSTAGLDEARARFGVARACDPAADRDRLLADTVARLEAVAADYADVHDTAFEAGLLVGYAERERGRLAEAAAAFGGAAELAGSLLQEEWRGKRTTDDACGEALARALWLRTQALCDQGAFDEAQASAKAFERRFPGAATRGDALAQLLEVERARATAGAGDAKAALALLEPLLARPASGAVARAARAAKREAAGQGSGDGLAPDDALRAAEALLERGQALQGLARLRLLIAQLEAAGERGEPSLVLAWSLSARVYLAAARLDEAGACFELLARRWPEDARAPRALLEAATCAGHLAALLPNDHDARRQRDALAALQTGYPDAPERHAGALVLGDLALGARRFPLAAALYAKVPETAGELHDLALHRVALAWQREVAVRVAAKDEAGAKDAHARALAALEVLLALGVDPTSDRGAALRRLQVEGWLRLAELHLAPLARAPERALEAARRAEEAGPAPERLAEARALAVQAHLARADLAAAEAALAGLVAVAPDAKRTAEAERDVAAALDAATRAGPAPDPALLARAADHYARWLTTSQRSGLAVSRLQAARAGDRLLRLALLLNGLPEGTFGFTEVPEERSLPGVARFEQAARAYELAAGLTPAPGEPGDGATAPWLVLVKLGQCLGFLGRFEPCVAAIDRAVALEGLVDGQGTIVPAVARARPPLLHAYADAAQAARRKGDLARAVIGFQRLVVVCPSDGALWWRSKYELLLALARQGDYTSASVGLRSLARTYPGFDGGRFGYRAKLEALAAEVATKQH